jgi:catechol 2,3-dioxygenase-like lactoylglutathione lyase family enzyme
MWLDHVGVIARDLDAAQAAYKRLGFRLTARSMHSGATVPGGPVEPWASGNHCAMFHQGYLEVLGEARATGHSSVRAQLQRYEGAHMVVFSSNESAKAMYAVLRARGIDAQLPRYLERKASFGEDGHDSRLARFGNVYVDGTGFPEATFIFIEHLTPEVLWQAHLLDHPNGVLALTGVGFVSPDSVGTAARLERLIGVSGVQRDAGRSLLLRDTAVHVTSVDTWSQTLPGATPVSWPAPAWIEFKVASLRQTASYLAAAGVPTVQDAQATWVMPQDAFGAALKFHEDTQEVP